MIVYNTTFHIENEVGEECLDYLKKIYIPRAASGGFLHTPYLRKVLQVDPEEGCSYSVQFYVKNVDTLNYWLEREGRGLHKELVDRFGSKVAGFSTLLEEIKWEQ